MLRSISYVLLTVSLSYGQQAPYGPTPVPFGVTPTAYTPTLAPNPINPTVSPFTRNVYPFGPVRGPGYNNYNNPYNNPYYNNGAGPAVPILTFSNDHNGDGSYSFSFSTADGKQAQESGYLKDAYIDNAGEPQGTQVVQGSYAYVAPDGTPIQVSYVADENGFRPSSVHFPADGKAVSPLPLGIPSIVDAKHRDYIFDPNFNRFDPYNRYDLYNRDPYNRNRYDQYDPYNRRYNYPYNRPYDARYPYPSRYSPFGINNVKQEPKKEKA